MTEESVTPDSVTTEDNSAPSETPAEAPNNALEGATSTEGDTTSEPSSEPSTPKTEPQTKKPPVDGDPLVEVTVDKKKMKVPLSKLKQRFSLEEKGFRNLEEAAKMRKGFGEFFERLKADPAKVLADPRLGVNFREVAENFLLQKLEEERMNPDQKARMSAEAEARKIAEENALLKRQQQDRENHIKAEYYRKQFNEQLGNALKESSLPKTPDTVHEVAAVWRRAAEVGNEISWKEAVDFVKSSYRDKVLNLLDNVEGDTLVEMLGPDVVEKLRKHLVKKATPAALKQPATTTNTPRKSKPQINMDDFFGDL